MDLLGDIKYKKILHLQCHFGQDTISLSKFGAKVTGVDLSDEAINYAKNLNSELGENCQFICSDIYDLKDNLEGEFDIVFASYGVIGWHPDVNKFMSIVEHYLNPAGQFVLSNFILLFGCLIIKLRKLNIAISM